MCLQRPGPRVAEMSGMVEFITGTGKCEGMTLGDEYRVGGAADNSLCMTDVRQKVDSLSRVARPKAKDPPFL